MALSERQDRWWQECRQRISVDDLAKTVAALVDLPTPTGEEGALAKAVVARLSAKGIVAEEQVIDAQQSNAVARLSGSGSKPSLMLYSPTDTVTSSSPEEDLPWSGERMFPELLARAHVQDGHVSGLGAQNPKGHAACVIIAFEILAASGIPFAGDVLLGLGAGGMPTNPRPQAGGQAGHGNGCDWMMRSDWKPDYAIIAKSGWSVSWEEVGLAWYEVRVKGTHTYVGSRHLIPYSNAIVNAGKVIGDLEAWFPQWAQTHRSGLVEPQGMVSWIEGGWSRMPAFTPAECRFRFDLRLSPRTTEEEADAAVAAVLEESVSRHDVELSCERIVLMPGTTTQPDNPVIATAVEAWEAVAGETHAPMSRMSGATDANILRGHGVPTARIGLPKAVRSAGDFQRGMNMVRVEDMVRLTEVLLYAAIAMCAER